MKIKKMQNTMEGLKSLRNFQTLSIACLSVAVLLLTCVAAKGLLNRAHAYKASVDKNVENGEDPDAGISMGLLYPSLSVVMLSLSPPAQQGANSSALQPPSSRLVVINNAAAQVPLRPGKKESGDIVVS